MRLVIMGGLEYHNDTILQPIIDCAEKKGVTVVWYKLDDYGANVHLPEYTNETTNMWVGFLNSMYFQDGDIVLVSDFWNPMIIPIKFYAIRKCKNIKFFSIHLGSSDLPGDFAGGDDYKYWCSAAETSWARCYDGIFFSSDTARTKFRESHEYNGNEYLSYLPISYIKRLIAEVKSECGDVERIPNRVIMPLRPNYDKGFDLFLEYAKNTPEKEFFVASPVPETLTSLPSNVQFLGNLDRKTLFKFELSCSYVASFARQETFGYSVLEALLCGCELISNFAENTSYKEFYEGGKFENSEKRFMNSEEFIVNTMIGDN